MMNDRLQLLVENEVARYRAMGYEVMVRHDNCVDPRVVDIGNDSLVGYWIPQPPKRHHPSRPIDGDMPMGEFSQREASTPTPGLCTQGYSHGGEVDAFLGGELVPVVFRRHMYCNVSLSESLSKTAQQAGEAKPYMRFSGSFIRIHPYRKMDREK